MSAATSATEDSKVEAANSPTTFDNATPEQEEFSQTDNKQAQVKRPKSRGRRKAPQLPPQNGFNGGESNMRQHVQRPFPRVVQNRNGDSAHEGYSNAPRRHRELFPAGTYKTEICRSHLQNGYCEYGLSCQFAHGIGELRPRHFDVKYKTQLCKNYHKDGVCRFASRCKFIHDEHRIQVDTNEFWLVSPSENLVRVEIVENAQRRQQLQALVESPPPPPPNHSILDNDMEEKKKQVLANARVAAARAAAARSAMQHAAKSALGPADVVNPSAFLGSVAASISPATQPQQFVSSMGTSPANFFDVSLHPYNIIAMMDANSQPAMAAPHYSTTANPVHSGMPNFYVPLS